MRDRSQFASAFSRTALVCLCALMLLTTGCRGLSRFIQGKLNNIENGISKKTGEIQDEFKVTITTMAVERQQYRKCEEIMRSWREAQSAYYADFDAYAPSLSAMQGLGKAGKRYVPEDISAAMSGVCYVVEMTATDTDYRMLFEVDKQALVREYQQKLKDKTQPDDQRRHLALRIEQLRTATPCRITATETDATASGQCGFTGDNQQGNDLK